MSLPRNIVLPSSDGPLDPSWTEPLEAVERAIRGIRRYQFFELGDFMIMNKVLRRPRPTLVLYKHRWTRRYLNLDAGGHAYRYHPPRDVGSNRSGQYRAHRDLRIAVDHLDLWELPWMKFGLEAHRHGLTAQERWVLRPSTFSLDDPDPAAVAAEYHATGWCHLWDAEDVV